MDPRIDTNPTSEALIEHADFLSRLAFELVGELHAAEDLVQDAYVVALEKPPASRLALSAWLSRVVRRRASNARRQNRYRSEREEDVARKEGQEPESTSFERIEYGRVILDAIQRLPEAQRSAIYLRYFEGQTPTEIAERQGVPVKTIKTRLSRALESLRISLDQNANGDRSKWLSALMPIAMQSSAANKAGLLATTKIEIGAASVTGILGGIAMKKMLLAGVAIVSVSIGWKIISSESVAPPEAETVQAASVQLNKPPQAIETLLGTTEDEHKREAIAVVSETEVSEFGSLRLQIKWHDGSPAKGVVILGKTKGVASERATDHHAVTGEDGVALMEALIPGEFEVRVTRGHRTSVGDVVAGETTQFDWTLPKGGTVRGIVEDSEGNVVPGAQIWLRDPHYEWTLAACVAKTNGDGTFNIESIDIEQSELGARASGYLAASDFRVSEMPKGPDGVSEAMFVLGERAGGITGKVIDPDGKPVAGAFVHADYEGGYITGGYSSNGEAIARLVSVLTDQDGRFELPGGYKSNQWSSSIPIRAQARGFPTYSGSVRPVSSGFVEHVIQLKHSATVTGRVTDFSGQSVAGAKVWCQKIEENRQPDKSFPLPVALTDSDGNFRLEQVPAGIQHFSAIGEDRQLGRDYQSAKCLSGETTVLDLQLDPHPLISGTVVDVEGNPLVGLMIDARAGMQTWRQQETDREGKFVLSNVGDTPMKLGVFSPGEWLDPHLTMRVHPGTEDLLLVVEDMNLEKGSVTGIFRDRNDQVPGDVKLLIYSKADPWAGQFVDFDRESGRFLRGPMAVGEYQFAFIATSAPVMLGDWIEIEEGQTLDVGVLRPLPVGDVEVVLSGMEFEEEFQPDIRLRSENQFEKSFARTNGRLLSGEASIGTWTIVSGGSRFYCLPTTVEVLPGKTQLVEIELQPAFTLRLSLDFANNDWATAEIEFTNAVGELLSNRTYLRDFMERSAKLTDSANSTYPTATSLPRGFVNVLVRTDNGIVASTQLEVIDGPAEKESHILQLE
ncbi:MAG: RNA polymerase sigma-70 factor (ECF subfamily) [Planctomycetota bacterium]|jgi:RNA polymerase sigma-70 factor (ECF subfamily)